MAPSRRALRARVPLPTPPPPPPPTKNVNIPVKTSSWTSQSSVLEIENPSFVIVFGVCLQRKQLNRGDYLKTKQFRSNSDSAFTVNEGIHVHVQRYIHEILSCTFGARFLSLLSEKQKNFLNVLKSFISFQKL